jgi:glycosyltransferase involved in cell wall biosynthesis
LNIEKQILFLGFREDIANLVGAADIFALPSLSEGMPLSLLEAMAVGCPVVASAVNGVPEVVRDGVDGLLTVPGDVESLAGRLRNLADDPKLRHSLSEAARRRVRESFTARQTAERVGELYCRHLAGK